MRKITRNLDAVQEILEASYPVGTKRQRADGMYVKKSDGTWAPMQKGHNTGHGSVKSHPVKTSPEIRTHAAIKKHDNFDSALADIVGQASSEESSSMAKEVGKLAYSIGHNLDSVYAKHGPELEAAGVWPDVVDAWHDKKADIIGRVDTSPRSLGKLV